MFRVLCLFNSILLLSLGDASFAGAAAGKTSANKEFAVLAEEFISGYLAWRPQMGTSLGLHQYDGEVTDYSAASVESELRRLQAFRTRLESLNTTCFSQRELADYRLLRASILREVFSFQAMKMYSENPMTYAGGLDVSIYAKRNFAPLPDRVRSITAILQKAPAIMVAARANLAESLPSPQLETAMEEATGAADFLSKDLIEAVIELKDPQVRPAFEQANQKAIRELRDYVAFLKDQKVPKANNRYALGRDKYIDLLKCELISLTPEQLLDIGMHELRRKQQEFAATAALINSRKKPIEVFREIQDDHPTESSLIPDTARNLEAIRQFVVDHHLLTIPSPVRARVKETPAFMRATSFASMDTPGPFEKWATEAYYYVTPPESSWSKTQKDEWLTAFNYYTTDIVSIHEAYPGHYVQFLCLNASPATKLEKIFTSYAFTEGWAHYAEQMMVDQGFGLRPGPGINADLQAAKYRLAQIDEALLRACRFCASIKIHCQGMNIEEAAKFFQENCYYAEKPSRQEAIRGAYDPEYLYYTLGKLEILKLRDDVHRQEGKRFSLRKFHDELLRHGAPPIRLLREFMLKDRTHWDQVL
jgi:uncharacterized protein (DUF885 family)